MRTALDYRQRNSVFKGEDRDYVVSQFMLENNSRRYVPGGLHNVVYLYR